MLDLQKCGLFVKSHVLGIKRHFGAHLQCWCLFTRKTCASFLQTYMHFRVTYRANFFEKSGNQPTEKILHCWRKYVCRINSKPANNPTENWNLIALRSYNTRLKSWNICVRFPFSNVDLCIAVIQAESSKYAWLNTGGGEEHISEFSVRTKVRGVNVRIFPENSSETVSVSTICDNYCRLPYLLTLKCR